MRLTTALAALLLVPASAGAQTIQPGDAMTYPDTVATVPGGSTTVCTLGWLYDGSDGNAYFSTAAHCADNGSTKVLTGDGQPLGDVALVGDPADAPTDVALIRVNEAMAPRVTGALRGNPEMPTGEISAGELAAGDQLRFSGWGIGVDSTEATREQRTGVYAEGSDFEWAGIAPIINGDSGGPVAHVATGKALGLNKGHRCGTSSALVCGSGGPAVASIHQLAARAGLTLTLRLAGQPAPARPAAPQPAAEPEKPAPAAEPAPAAKPAAAKKPSCRKKAKKIKSKRKRKAALKRCAKKR